MKLNKNNNVLSIHYLRGVAALMVVLYHFKAYLPKDSLLLNSVKFAAFGVDLFFIISGFVIVYSTQKIESVSAFFVKRILRIWPPLIVCSLVFYFFVENPYSLNDLLNSILLIHKDYNSHGPEFGYNMLIVAWTITYEVFFYFLFMISMAISQEKRVVVCSLIILLLVISLQVSVNCSVGFNAGSYPFYDSVTYIASIPKIIGNSIMLEFLVGMVMAVLYIKHQEVSIEKHKNLILFSFFCILPFVVACYFSGFHRGMGLFLSGKWAFFLVLFGLLFDKLGMIRENYIISFLGNISYSLYLNHILVNEIIKQIAPPFLDGVGNDELSGVLKVYFSLSVSVVMAYVMFVLVEQKSISYARTIIAKYNL